MQYVIANEATCIPRMSNMVESTRMLLVYTHNSKLISFYNYRIVSLFQNILDLQADYPEHYHVQQLQLQSYSMDTWF